LEKAHPVEKQESKNSFRWRREVERRLEKGKRGDSVREQKTEAKKVTIDLGQRLVQSQGGGGGNTTGGDSTRGEGPPAKNEKVRGG